jgi:hypothetical protein
MGRYWAERAIRLKVAQWARPVGPVGQSPRFLSGLYPAIKRRHSGPLSGSAEQQQSIAHTGNQPMKSYEKSRFGPWQFLGLMNTPALAAPPTTRSTICRHRVTVATLRFVGIAACRHSAGVEVITSALTRPRFPLCPLFHWWRRA